MSCQERHLLLVELPTTFRIFGQNINTCFLLRTPTYFSRLLSKELFVERTRNKSTKGIVHYLKYKTIDEGAANYLFVITGKEMSLITLSRLQNSTVDGFLVATSSEDISHKSLYLYVRI